MSKHAGTDYSLVAELTRGMPNGEIPCGSIRMVSQWDGIPVSFCASTWALGRTRSLGDLLHTRPESHTCRSPKIVSHLSGGKSGG
jgi:hypothetical protein